MFAYLRLNRLNLRLSWYLYGIKSKQVVYAIGDALFQKPICTLADLIRR